MLDLPIAVTSAVWGALADVSKLGLEGGKGGMAEGQAMDEGGVGKICEWWMGSQSHQDCKREEECWIVWPTISSPDRWTACNA